MCMIFTFSIRHSLHFLEEAVKALAVAMVFHLMVYATPASFNFQIYPANEVLTLLLLCLKVSVWLLYRPFQSGLASPM